MFNKKKVISYIVFIYFVLSLIFSIGFGPLIESQTGFSYTDEALYSGLIVMFILLLKINKEILIFCLIFLFYLLYSWRVVNSNTKPAILMDLFIQSKPFMAFFIICAAAPVFSKRQKKWLRVISMGLFVYLIFIGLWGWSGGNITKFMRDYYNDTGAAYSTGVLISALFVLMYSHFRKKDKFMFMMMLVLSMITFKSRMYGFFAVGFFMLYWSNIFFGRNLKPKLTVQNVAMVLVVLAAGLLVGWDKLQAYYNPTNVAYTARLVLLEGSFQIFKDFVPFGSGFASFGTEASRASYSHIYDYYRMSSVWGLSRRYPAFITDIYLPSLAQFGICGVGLFILFWRNVIRKNKVLKIMDFQKPIVDQWNVIFLLIVIFLAIASIASSILTSKEGLMLMSMLALCIVEKRNAIIQSGNQIFSESLKY